MIPENYLNSSMNFVKLQVTKLKHRNLFHFYAQTMKDQKDIFKKQPHLPSYQKE